MEQQPIPSELAQTFEYEQELMRLADLYALVFADPPWNEFTRSVGCNSFFGRESTIGDTCPNCGDSLIEAYPKIETALYINKELQKPNSILSLLKKEGEIIAFAWGFSIENPALLASQKYQTEDMKRSIVGTLEANNIPGTFFYFSECGVSPNERGRGLSNQLCAAMTNQAERLGQPLVMRTNYQSPMVKVAAKFGMRQIMGPTPDGVANFLDGENPERVMFAKLQ